MQNLVRNALIQILSFLNYLFPKGNIIAFCSLPDFSDNAAAMFEYLTTYKSGKYLLVWLLKWGDYNETKAAIIQSYANVKVICARKDSLQGLYYFLRSKYLFFTHGIYGHVAIPKRQIAIHLAHGMPIKRFGLLDEKSPSKPPRCSYVVSTSELFQPILARAFGVKEEHVLSLGSPRNDWVFDNRSLLGKLAIDRDRYAKIVLWMPTFRVSVLGQVRTDGTNCDSGLPLLSNQQVVEFDDFLRSQNMFCIIKPHPMSPAINRFSFTELHNIVFINQDSLLSIHADIHSLLAEVDVLLTDYSSIFFDFLLVNRPIGFIHEDIHQYEVDRGFVLQPIHDWTPGNKIFSFTDLKTFLLETQRGEDGYQQKREEVRQKAHHFSDGHSRQRLVEYFNL